MPLDVSKYTCTGGEPYGAADVFDNGVKINTLNASRCFIEWYCEGMGYTWAWRNGVDPDDPTTWPGYEPPPPPETDPGTDPDPSTTP